ncbi:MAG: PIN domain nuclease, partial [Candidatus Jacksonbacteria bacterium]
PVIALNKEIISLAQDYIRKKIIPSAKLFDAYHLAVATIHKIDILVSWNYNHIANKFTEEQVNKFNVLQRYHQITIEFPLKLLTPK